MSRFVPVSTGCLLLAGAFALIGCASTPPTQSMVNADFVGDRTAKYMLLNPGKSEEQATFEFVNNMLSDEDIESLEEYHFVVQLCDVQEDEEVNCQETTVLENVTTSPNPGEDEEIVADRELTSIFWYDADTLFLSYLEDASLSAGHEADMMAPGLQPKVTMCHARDDNTMRCSEEQEIADMLQVRD